MTANRRVAPVVCLVLVAAACGTSAPVANGAPSIAGVDWPMYRADLSREGHLRGAVLDPVDAARLKLSWTVDLGAAVDGTPVVSNGSLVVETQGGRLAAFDAHSGSLRWAVDGLGPMTGSPTISGAVVVAGTLSGHVYEFERARGTRLWDWSAPGVEPAIWASPAVDAGLVVIGIGSQSGDTPLEVGRLVALNLATGKQVWTTCVMAGCAAGGGIWSTPSVDASGRAFVGTGNPDDGVLAFDFLTGRVLWREQFHADSGRDLDVGESPVILHAGGSEVIAIGSVSGTFKELDAGTGNAIWSRDLVAGSAVHGLLASPAYDGVNLYVPSASPPTGMFALSPASGSVLWQHSVDQPVYSAPAAGSGVVVFGTGDVFGDVHVGSIIALSSADGHALWSYDVHSAVFSSPAIVGSTVLVGDSKGDLLAFRPSP